MADVTKMTRAELVAELKRLRREEDDLRAECQVLTDKVLAPTERDLQVVRGLLQLEFLRETKIRM